MGHIQFSVILMAKHVPQRERDKRCNQLLKQIKEDLPAFVGPLLS
jgi:hypothetical protein